MLNFGSLYCIVIDQPCGENSVLVSEHTARSATLFLLLLLVSDNVSESVVQYSFIYTLLDTVT